MYFWHTYFLYGFPLDKPTYIYHAKSRFNTPVLGSLHCKLRSVPCTPKCLYTHTFFPISVRIEKILCAWHTSLFTVFARPNTRKMVPITRRAISFLVFFVCTLTERRRKRDERQNNNNRSLFLSVVGAYVVRTSSVNNKLLSN